jgi:peptidoglycan/LPS O-acetylase OafA/YrhL
MTREFRKDIQSLRGLAVLSVLFFHVDEKIFSHGFLGVDIFFVISGFVVTPLMMRIFKNDNNDGLNQELKKFYYRRFYRLAPALSVTIIFTMLLYVVFMRSKSHSLPAEQGIASLLLLGNFGAYSLSGDYFSNSPNPLLHTWSLSVEEQIYFLFPLILVIFFKKNIHRTKRLVFLAITLISLSFFVLDSNFDFILNLIGIQQYSSFSFYSPLSRAWQFSLGSLAYIIQNERNKFLADKIKSKIFSAVILAMSLLLIFIFNTKADSIVISFTATTLIILRSLENIPDKLIQILNWIGDRSYSIYLLHMPILIVAKNSPVFQIGYTENRYPQTLIGVIITFVLSTINYTLIENRYRGSIRIFISLKEFSYFFLFPIILLVSILLASQSNYWGIGQEVKPAYVNKYPIDCAKQNNELDYCKYNSGSNKTVLLVGDSHAAHISEALINASKKVNWNFLYMPDSFIGTIKNISRNSSDVALDSKIKSLAVNENVSLIIVSQFITPSQDLTPIKAQLKILSELNIKLLIIENTPVWPDRARFHFNNPWIRHYEPPKWFMETELDKSYFEISFKLSNWANKFGIYSLNLNDVFCKNGICTRFWKNQWLYIDNNHFSKFGASLVTEKLIQALKQFQVN